MSKDSRSGGKFTGKHTTLIPAARILADASSKCPHVTKISLGYIKAGLSANKGPRRAKITGENGYILLSVRDNTTNQEVHIYTNDRTAAIEAIAKTADEVGIEITLK